MTQYSTRWSRAGTSQSGLNVMGAPTGTVAAHRVHAEYLAQASGTSAKWKNDQTAKQTIELLHAAELADPDIEYDFLRQLAFNTMIGHADARAENYSVLLRPDLISLAPLYDAVPVSLYPSSTRTSPWGSAEPAAPLQ